MAGGSVGKRKAERRDCYVKAQALVPGRDPVDCIIINFSATGARARLSAEAELPARFKNLTLSDRLYRSVGQTASR